MGIMYLVWFIVGVILGLIIGLIFGMCWPNNSDGINNFPK